MPTTVAPRVGELGGSDTADLAEALDDAALLGEVPAQPLARALDHHHDAGAGRLVAEQRAADARSACRSRSRARRGPSASSTCPSSRPSSARSWPCPGPGCPPWGRSPAAARTCSDASSARSRPSTCRAGLQRTPPFAPPYGKAQQRALPRHPHRERGALAERDVRVVADAALRRPEHRRVLHPIRGEDAHLARVEVDRHGDDDRALRDSGAARLRSARRRRARAPARTVRAPSARAAHPTRASSVPLPRPWQRSVGRTVEWGRDAPSAEIHRDFVPARLRGSGDRPAPPSVWRSYIANLRA